MPPETVIILLPHYAPVHNITGSINIFKTRFSRKVQNVTKIIFAMGPSIVINKLELRVIIVPKYYIH